MILAHTEYAPVVPKLVQLILPAGCDDDIGRARSILGASDLTLRLADAINAQPGTGYDIVGNR